MRTAFINQLITEAERNDEIFLLVGDLGFSVVERYAEKFPERFLNVGIAEQNMTGLACGLAMEGYKVFTYSIGNFPTLRTLEQIRYDVCYHDLDVNVVSVGAGYAYGALGVSHHTTEDIGVMRSLPNLSVCCPSDPVETRSIVSMICKERKGPHYLRLGKAGERELHHQYSRFNWGEVLTLREGKNVAILGCGNIMSYVLESDKYKEAAVFSFPFLTDVDSRFLIELCKEFNYIITIEEHQRRCGFGSAILEELHDLLENDEIKNIPSLKRIAIPNKYLSKSGSQDFLRSEAGLLL